MTSGRDVQDEWEVKWSCLILRKELRKTIKKFTWSLTFRGVRIGTEVYEILNRCANQSTAIFGENAWSFTFTSHVFKHWHLSNLIHSLDFFFIWCCLRGHSWNSLVDIATKPLAGPSGDLGSIPSRRKRPGCETDSSHIASAVLKNAWSFTSPPHSPSVTVGTVPLSWGWSGRSVALTTHPYLTSRLKKLVEEVELYRA
jgi:hypothetical protein